MGAEETDGLRSREVTSGLERAPTRAMLVAVGLCDEDFSEAQIGVAAAASDVTPCNMGLAGLSNSARRGVVDARGVALGFSAL